MTPPPAPVIRYGDHPDQVANLHLPDDEGGPWPAVVVLHGGFWRERWDRTTTTPVACDLALRGLVAWNVEYRRVGQDGGGWRGTLDDVAAAVDALAAVEEADLERVVALGHSAGAHLALWLAARTDARVRVRAAIALAGVADLVAAARDGLGDGAVVEFLGGSPDDVPERYAAASPAALLPLRVPQLLVHGAADPVVPLRQSVDYAKAARSAGDVAEVVEVAGAGHFDVIDPGHTAWAVVAERLPRLVG